MPELISYLSVFDEDIISVFTVYLNQRNLNTVIYKTNRKQIYVLFFLLL